MTTYDGAFSADVEQLQDWLLSSATLQEFLHEIATHLVDSDEDGLSCGITVRTAQHRPFTIGSSDGLAQKLDEVQYEVDDGPCLHALRHNVTVDMPDLADQVRWPDFHRQALQAGLTASLSIPMLSHGAAIGALNVYGRANGGLSPEQHKLAGYFAERAGGAIALATQLAEYQNLTADLQTALTSRATIDQALGILMGQQRCTADEAFAILRKASQHRNIKLRDLAAETIEHVTGRPPQPGQPLT